MTTNKLKDFISWGERHDGVLLQFRPFCWYAPVKRWSLSVDFRARPTEEELMRAKLDIAFEFEEMFTQLRKDLAQEVISKYGDDYARRPDLEEQLKAMRASRDYWRDGYFTEGARAAKYQHRLGQIAELYDLWLEEEQKELDGEAVPAREE